MSKDQKKQPVAGGKKAPSAYQTGKTAVTKPEIIITGKKKK